MLNGGGQILSEVLRVWSFSGEGSAINGATPSSLSSTKRHYMPISVGDFSCFSNDDNRKNELSSKNTLNITRYSLRIAPINDMLEEKLVYTIFL